MNFSFSDEQEAVRDLSARIFADNTSHERIQALEKSGEWHDSALWAELSEANLTAISLPEAVGGGGCSIFETCLLLEEQGRHLAPVPLVATLLLGGLALAQFGSREQQERWLRPVAESGAILTGALHETGASLPSRPKTRAERDGDGWRISGTKVAVPAADLAKVMLIPARTDDAAGVFLVEPTAPGVSLERQVTTNREPQSQVVLDGVSVAADARLGDAASDVTGWMFDQASVGLCALQLGIAEEALRRTAIYTTDRKQFGVPIGSFQGVQVRAADAFIDIEAMRSTLWQAAWRLAEGRPAARHVSAARWWASIGGHRVTHAAQHLHGGTGSDVDYPIHRFMLWAKQVESTLGGATPELARLGKIVIDEAGERA
ncbi:MAG: acyl-CoA/acyl-ACP dehydrogenase [Deltaproteobacteria bacterium]|nr:acyl-CoA/acyl-ACP dehydrogenase [Deltaproteobacteria bacterium]MBW2362028.1 acyl-CoA/acyl-ACP dehydrogenase [Deltaproteobacteria bacterium]